MYMVLALVLCFAAVLAGYTTSVHARRLPLPPGPRGLPLLGNALQVPAEHSWLTFTRWAKTYGAIVHFKVFGASFVVLNTREAISELLERRGAIYSDRPRMPMVGELAGLAQYFVFMPYGPSAIEGRKLVLSTIIQRRTDLQKMQEEKAVELISRLLHAPSEFQVHILWHVANLVLRITHGLAVDNYDDPLVQLTEKANAEVSRLLMPGAHLVDSLPLLMHVPEWFPGAGFKKVAREVGANYSYVMDLLYKLVKDDVARGTAVPSLIGDFIQNNPNPTAEQENMYKRASTTFYSVGSDTTVAAIDNVLIMMAQHVDIQRKAQAELDAVTGGTRLPRFSDRKDLPYLEAALKEGLRLNPVAPLALPHKVRKEDEYAGCHIPAGCTVLTNLWALMRDPSLYPNPEEVSPERYLKPSAGHDSEGLNPDPRLFVFGFGRRVCAGKALADDSMFIVAASILAVFDVSDAAALDGSPVKYEGGVLFRPAPFRCTLTPRRTSLVHALQAV